VFGASCDVMAPGFQATFYEDESLIKWTSSMAYGSEYAG
jgi:hypothetical protein